MAYPFGRTNHNRAFANLWFADPLGDYVTNTIMYKKVDQLGSARSGNYPILLRKDSPTTLARDR